MKTVAIVQARMGSSRLPGKVLLPLAGICSLDWCILRLRHLPSIDEVCVATTTNPVDEAIIIHLERWGNLISIHRGPEDNVLLRTVNAVSMTKADIIVDVTSDCPMVDPVYVELLLHKLKGLECDYTSNVMIRSWPDGCDIQCYTREALLKLFDRGEDLVYEHSGWNFVTNKNLTFMKDNWLAPKRMRHPKWRWTLDTPRDWQRLEWMISEMVKHEGNFYCIDMVNKVLGLDDLDPNIVKEMMGC